MSSQSPPSRASFRAIAHLVANVDATDDSTDVAELARALRQTPGRVRAIIDRAAKSGLLEVAGNVVVLSPAGRRLRDKIKLYESEAQTAAQERFTPYTDYQPRGWLTPRHRGL
jgi:DNA-binding MarR family transcriptional regulator